METKIIVAATAGFVVGGAVGFLVTRKVLEQQTEHYIMTEIGEANQHWKAHWQRVYAKPDITNILSEKGELKSEDLNENGISLDAVIAEGWIKERMAERATILEQMQDQVEEYDTETDEEPEEVNPVAVVKKKSGTKNKQVNIFEEAEKVQDPTVPRIISIDEFMEDAQDFTKISVTYFEGDDTMIDSGEQSPVDDVQRLVGDEFLKNWGKNSKDPNVVYVRNMALEVDFEITRDKRTFEEWILGPVPKTRARKMREDD